jgi:glycosyltransferase involved in cell wall biosynthesis
MAGNGPIRVGLFGASSLGRQCLEQLRHLAHHSATHDGGSGEATAVCFFDNDARKWTTSFEGVPVSEPTPAALNALDVIWLSTAYADEVQAQIKKLGVTTRLAHTLHEVLGTTTSTAFRADACGPRVNIVIADEGWILERCGREIEKRLPYARVSRQADPSVDINYYVNYSAFKASTGTTEIGFFTHIEERAPEAARRFFHVAKQMTASVAMSERYAARLRDAGVANVHVITPGVDLDRFQPSVKIGVVGRTYRTGRKGEDLLRAVMDEPHIEWHFTGEGWPGPGKTYSDEEMPAFYRSMDYVLVPAHYEGGPMPLLEALASGVEVIAPRVGFVDEYPHIEFEAGNAADLRRVLRDLVAVRLDRRRAVESRTWDAWAKAHDTLFRQLGTSAATQAAAPAISRETSGDNSTRPLRVLFALHAPESVVPVGGPSIRLPRMQQALAAHGVHVDIAREEFPDPRGYDLVHVFNIWEPGAALRQLQHLRGFDVPILFSPIFLKLEEGLWAQRAVLPVFRQNLSDAEFAKALEGVAATPMDVREATGLALDANWEQWPARVREITALADHLVMLSEREMSALNRIGALGTSFSLVHNGVDPTWADGATGDAFRERFGVKDYVLSVGRLEPRKNQLLLARALRDTNIDLVLVGEPAKPEYADLVRRHGGRVHMVGKLSHEDPLLRSAFAGARAFALPSWSEGAPLAALEAASFGLPLVLSDRSGEQEYFGPLARYCDPLDLDGLRHQVAEAVAEPVDSELREARRGLIGRALTWAHSARETAQAYARVRKDRRADHPLPGGFKVPGPRRLEIGSGMNPQRGYEHLDARPDLPDIDHVADIRHALPFPSGTFDEVMSRSCIEHVSWREVRPVLTEWGRILKPGGKLDVWTPDFEYLCRQYLARRDDRHLDPALADEARRALGGYDAPAWAIIKMFGGQDYPENFHGAVMDEEVLTRVLQVSGFARVERREPFGGLRLWAERTPAFQHLPTASESAPAVPGTWAAAEPPSVIWDSPAFNFGGYASLTRHVMRALVPAGVSVQLRSRDDEGGLREQCLASPKEGWLWSRTLRRQVSAGGAYVCCYTPADWKGQSIFQARRDEHKGMKTYVGLTMFETDRLPQGWREACDALDEIWVPSQFNKNSFTRAGVPEDKLQVVPIGIDASRYDPATISPLDIPGRRGFVFLSVFDWSLRKGWDVLLRAYTQAFTATDDVTLVLRTAKRGSGPSVKMLVADFLATLGDRATQPAVVVLDEPLPEDEMPRLYRAADAFVMPTRGEGWGLPVMEAMASALPVIVTRWGAHLDFANDDNALLIDNRGTVAVGSDSQQSAFYGADHRWADPSPEHLVALMRQVMAGQDAARRLGQAAREAIRGSWTPARTAAWISERLTRLAPDPTISMDLGRRAEAAGQLDEAEQHYARAGELKPGWMLPLYNRASVLKRQRRRSSARGLFEQIARHADTHDLRGGSWYHLGELAFEENRLDDATAAFEACLVDRPEHRRARGWIAFIRGRGEEQAQKTEAARDAYRDALTLAGTWPLATYNLASTLKRLGDLDDAQMLFADVCQNAEQAALRGGAHFHLAEMHATASRMTAALGHLDSCLMEIPTHAAATRLLESLSGVSTR